MNYDTAVKKGLVKTGAVAGIAVVVMYVTPKLLPLPGFLSTAFFIYQGPLLVVVFLGLYPLFLVNRSCRFQLFWELSSAPLPEFAV